MASDTLLFLYLLMIWLQVIHIFEEITCGVYKITHGLNKYLMVASLLVSINLGTFALILYEWRTGLFLGLFTSGVMAIGNGLVHTTGYLKTKSTRDGVGAGVFSSIPLGIVGILVFIQLIRSL